MISRRQYESLVVGDKIITTGGSDYVVFSVDNKSALRILGGIENTDHSEWLYKSEIDSCITHKGGIYMLMRHVALVFRLSI